MARIAVACLGIFIRLSLKIRFSNLSFESQTAFYAAMEVRYK
jgi:hypothetical protein